MKAFLSVFVVTFSLVLLITQCEKYEPLVNLNEPYFTITDQAFLDALIDEGVDINGDNLISDSEAEAITQLTLVKRNISDMTGIERFVNLDKLYCDDNQLTSLDVTMNTALVGLWCGENQLTSLDISRNTIVGGECGWGCNDGLDLSNMPSLHEVCVWIMPFPPEGVTIFAEGSPNAFFTTDCSQ